MAKVCKKTPLTENGTVVGMTFAFENGKVHQVKFGDFSDEVRKAAEANGFAQKLGDAYAGSHGNPTVAEQLFLAVLETLQEGSWNKGARGPSMTAILTEAIVRLTKRESEEVVEMLASKTKEEIAALKKRKDVQKVIKEIELERAKAAEGEDEEDLESLL